MSKTVIIKGDDWEYKASYYDSKMDIYRYEPCRMFDFEAERVSYMSEPGSCLVLEDKKGNTARIHDGWYDMDAREVSPNLEGLGIENLGPDDIPVTHSHYDITTDKLHFECKYGEFNATFSAAAVKENFDIIIDTVRDDPKQLAAHEETLAQMQVYKGIEIPEGLVTKNVQEHIDHHSLMVKEDVKMQETEIYL